MKNRPTAIELDQETIAKLLTGMWKVPFILDGEQTFAFHPSERAAIEFALTVGTDAAMIQPPVGHD